ncbi:glutaredoxin domain-containing protein [Metabacillus iocasae]|uniref:Glutaredoxin n=1 Tax=Priestia iocasae TaxID=2291674 RepID=A0ABS2QQJ7_9BACI|nr:glutaredoxin [Metabacillus iocasae]
MKPVLYIIDGCHNCFEVRRHLVKEEIQFDEINLLHNRQAAKELKRKAGEITAPVFIQGNIIIKDLNILQVKKTSYGNNRINM